jgi:protein SCO1/2
MPYRRAICAFVVTLAIALTAIARPAFALSGASSGASNGFAAGPGYGSASDEGTPIVPPGLEDVGVQEHLDGQIPMDAQFHDQTGKAFRFGDLFDGKRPVLLTLAYHTCPTVCSMVLSQTVETMKKVGWTAGKEYVAITLSFDPRETMERTAAKRTSLLGQYGRPEAEQGWHFLLGDDTNIHRVTDAVGFHYHYVEHEQQFAHPTVIMLLKPNGQVARYLYGLEYSPNDVRIGLLEASNGKSISTIERVILYCYHYDPQGGKYVLLATRVMQIGGGITAIALVSFLSVLWIRDRKRH